MDVRYFDFPKPHVLQQMSKSIWDVRYLSIRASAAAMENYYLSKAFKKQLQKVEGEIKIKRKE